MRFRQLSAGVQQTLRPPLSCIHQTCKNLTCSALDHLALSETLTSRNLRWSSASLVSLSPSACIAPSCCLSSCHSAAHKRRWLRLLCSGSRSLVRPSRIPCCRIRGREKRLPIYEISLLIPGTWAPLSLVPCLFLHCRPPPPPPFPSSNGILSMCSIFCISILAITML
jgi:hypothetical protein